MARITGIGGVFFRADDPETLSAWYRNTLGIDMSNGIWFQDAGPTVFAPFQRSTDYFSRDSQQFMLNLRVDHLDELLATFEQTGLAFETRAEWDGEHGRFARIHDPEGNPIELWEAPEPPADHQT